jgi:xanthine dehydrogenase accessory factor
VPGPSEPGEGGRVVRMDWLAEARELAEAGKPFALATVVRRVAPASAQTGAKAVIFPDGSMRGWVGGSCTQPVVVAEARQALRDGAPRLLSLGRFPGASQADDIVEYPMTCHSGGALEILIEPILPLPKLIIVGQTPVAATLGELARVMGYRITAVDGAAALAALVSVPEAVNVVIVASLGDDDEAALAGALRAGIPYVALVASPRRAAAVRETLAAMDVSREAIERLRAPAGLDIGARTQEEIALSIMAEIVQLRATATLGEAMAEPARQPAAIDPVCGMTVVIAEARHVTEYDGKSWYFCCAGCKARFEADPAQFAAA